MAIENEIGRELKVSELKQGTVVVVAPPGRHHGVFFTMWVSDISAEMVRFYSGELRWHVINFVMPDGSLVDDKGRVVRVHEYLGEI